MTYFRVNAWGAVLLCTALACVSWGFGDVEAMLLWLLVAALGSAFIASLPYLSSSGAYTLGVLLGFSFITVGHWVLPAGAAAVTTLVPVSASISALARSTHKALVLNLVVFAYAALLHTVGFAGSAASVVPIWYSVCGVVGIGYAGTVIQLTSARARYDRIRLQLVAAEAELRKEECAAQLQLDELERATAQIRAFNDRLGHQVRREALLTADLLRQREEETHLVSAIHHDLREPLRSIVSFSQLIRRRLTRVPEAKHVEEYLAFAEDGGQRMARMLSDLLSYTQGGCDDSAADVVKLEDLLDDVCDNLVDAIDRTGAEVSVGILPAVYGHQTLLVQLFQNLLANALKFAKPDVDPLIRIYQEVNEEGQLLIQVADNGIGIPANQLDKVFGLFNRAHDPSTYEGSGVGLALCKRIAISHGATLSVASEEGVGTTFSLAFSEYAPAATVARAKVIAAK